MPADAERIVLTQDQLIAGCIRREPASQKALFDLYARPMLGVCLRYARNQADAEDILQDAFIKIFEKIGTFRSLGSFEGWIRRIVVHTALKKYSLSRFDKERVVAEPGLYESADSGDPEAFGQLSEKELLALIHQLPDGYRLVFNLYVIEGYSHEEIAGQLRIQPGTSRSQLAKARMMLQHMLAGIYEKNK